MPEKTAIKNGFYPLVLLAGFATASSAALANGAGSSGGSELTPYTARYVLEKSGLDVAEATFTLARENGGWRFESHAKPVGLAAMFVRDSISEHSLFRLENGRVEPLEYRLSHSDKQKAAEENVHVVYDRQAGHARVQHGRGKSTLSLEKPLYDTLSEQAALMLAVRGPDPQADFRVIDEDRAERHRFTLESADTVDTPRGPLAAIKAVRKHGSRHTLIWLVPELNYLPVKIHRYRKGELKSALTLKAVNFNEISQEPSRHSP